METRLYFLFGDILVNAVAGAAVVIVCDGVFGDSFPAVVAMVGGMALGSVVALGLAMVAGAFLGMFEVMLPVMTTGMFVGMLAAMPSSAVDMTTGYGSLIGIGILGVTYTLNRYQRMRSKSWTS